jgi:5-formyltetrahydrofolate cyclo-ligase
MSHGIDPEVVELLAQRAKVHLRKRARSVRGAVARSALEARSAALVARLLEHPWLEGVKTVASFWPIEGRSEVDLRAIDPALRARGVTVVYPSIDPDTRRMCFRDPSEPERMEERGLGFAEPDPSLPEAERIDVVLTPCLLVDATGARLGYGGGFYDATLPSYCPPGRAIAVAYDFQLQAEVPTSSRDVRVDAVVTDARALEASR